MIYSEEDMQKAVRAAVQYTLRQIGAVKHVPYVDNCPACQIAQLEIDVGRPGCRLYARVCAFTRGDGQ